MPTMPPPEDISELEERILHTLWRLGGIGKNLIREATLRSTLSGEALSQSWTDEINNLQKQGFLQRDIIDGHDSLSLTPLGLSLLRKIEEDRLQELK